jgi:hypothetical protein
MRKYNTLWYHFVAFILRFQLTKSPDKQNINDIEEQWKKQLEVILCILIIWWIPPKNQTISWCSLNWRHSMKSTHLLQLYNKMYFSRRKFSQSSRFDINTISKIRLLMYTLTSLSQHISYELRKILLVLNCPSQKRPPLLFSHFSLCGLIKGIQLSTVKPV